MSEYKDWVVGDKIIVKTNSYKKKKMVEVKKFGASWCGPCRALAPILTELKSEFKNVSIIEYDVDDNFENCDSNDPQNDIKDRQENITQNKVPPKRKTSIQIAVDNALLVLVKYLPMSANQSAKIY